VTVIDTRPWGHDDIHEYMYRIQNIWLVNELFLLFFHFH
jgi:hypothetical protein